MAKQLTKDPGNAKRLAQNARSPRSRQTARSARKNSLRPLPRGDSRRALGDEHDISPLARLMGALSKEEIRFQLVGMSAAVLQGVPVATFDVDLWLDLSPRQYMLAIRVALKLGATMVRNTVVELSDGTLVNFLFEITGLGNFSSELRRARRLRFHGMTLAVLPLESIRKSKAAINRPKDAAHIHYLDETMRLARMTRRAK
jgi:hypothetical protein